MALEDWGERLEGAGWIGVAVGAAVLAPVLIPAVSRGLRPLAKGAIKGYLSLADRTREMFAESGEQWQDLVAEAKAEHSTRANGSEMMLLEDDEKGGETPAVIVASDATPISEADAHEEGRHATRRRRSEPEPAPA